MPRRMSKICQSPGCGQLCEGAYCDEHRIKKHQYDNRESAYRRGYDRKWQKVREAYLSQQPLCEMCEEAGITKLADLVHHIVRIRDGGDRLNKDNLMSLCIKCHDKVHNGEGHKW
jgi:5-methylcytosine-specific restriction protein A